MLLGPALLAGLSVLLVLPPMSNLTGALLASAGSAVLGKTIDFKLKLWHGFNLPLVLSTVAVAGGGLLYTLRRPIWRLQAVWPERLRIDALYDGGLVGLNRLAVGLTRTLQTGTLRHYLLMILSTLLGLVGYALLSTSYYPKPIFSLDGVSLYEILIAVLMVVAALAVVFSPSRLGAIAALGTVGYMMALFYVLYSGPDLALTQLLVETLTVIFLLLVFYFLPRFFEDRTAKQSRLRDALIAAGTGIMITLLVLMAVPQEFAPSISSYYLENSLPLGYGANVVNVILVDFRALDTLGEISVLVIAALSAYGLIKLRPQEKKTTENNK
jgi:multicomponent Na+:H+ antiporter subunit A